jgi:hypothetical protein
VYVEAENAEAAVGVADRDFDDRVYVTTVEQEHPAQRRV